jgi:acetyltransferase-like isoleucine patch superfamily enzyme
MVKERLIGNNTTFGFPAGGRFKSTYCELQARYEDARIKIGENVAINNGFTIISAASVEIGDDTLIGRQLQISDHDGHGIMTHERRVSKGQVEYQKSDWQECLDKAIIRNDLKGSVMETIALLVPVQW